MSSSEQQGGKNGLVLAILAATQFLMTVDATVMNVSIANLVEDLDTSVTAIQGVITTYTLVMAAFMITGGKFGDILGRKRAYRIGLIVYAAGSFTTAISPTVGVLLVGWSILEGLGAVLIMPTIVALIAGNFTGRARASAYGTIAAASAVAIAVGPIIGGFVTANFSWRWVFIAEVFIAFGLLALSTKIADVEADETPKLDGVGVLLSATGLAALVFGVLQTSSWGWVVPRVPEGPDATAQFLNLSLSFWFVIGGFLLLWGFMLWLRRRKDAGREPLVDPDLFAVRQLRAGLSTLGLQFVITNGLFFTVPLFLSIVLGLSAFETGLRLLPLSIALVVVAPAVPKLAPHASPRSIVRIGLGLILLALLLLASLFSDDADSSIVTIPFVLVGAGFGMLASQLGNVIVSAVSVDRSSEVGGLQYTAQNLGASLGTALVGAVVIGGLGTLIVEDLAQNETVDEAFVEEVGVELQGGIQFLSDDQLADGLASTDLTEEEQAAILDANSRARIDALRKGMVVLALLSVVGLFVSASLPNRSLSPPDDEELEDAPASA